MSIMSILYCLLALILRNGPTFDVRNSTPTLGIYWPSFAYLQNICPVLFQRCIGQLLVFGFVKVSSNDLTVSVPSLKYSLCSIHHQLDSFHICQKHIIHQISRRYCIIYEIIHHLSINFTHYPWRCPWCPR